MDSNEIRGLHDLPHANPLHHSPSVSYTHKNNPFSNLLNMQPDEVGHHSLSHENPTQNPESMPFSFSRFFPDSQPDHVPLNEFSPNPSSLSNDITSDEAKKLQQSIIHERRRKRMISNRESARRSRMRKKKQIEELQYQVKLVQTTNQQLAQKLIQLFECNQQILQENARLKEKVSSLQIVLADLLTFLRNVEEVTCNVNSVGSTRYTTGN